jgi:hypothetical protein
MKGRYDQIKESEGQIKGCQEQMRGFEEPINECNGQKKGC